MNLSSYAEKHYKSAHTRMFESVLDRFFKENIPQVGGAELRALLSFKLIELFDKYMIIKNRLKPGQMLWIAVDKNTRADSKKVKYVPVVLTLVDNIDINDLAYGGSNGNPGRQLPGTIARICNEAYNQGGLLSMRDIALIFKRLSGVISLERKKYEERNDEILPTTAVLHDMGSGISHKKMILKKILVEKKDMHIVRNETKHSQRAIDHYIKDYWRIAMLLDENKSVDYISKVTTLSKHLIEQYKAIYLTINNEND